MEQGGDIQLPFLFDFVLRACPCRPPSPSPFICETMGDAIDKTGISRERESASATSPSINYPLNPMRERVSASAGWRKEGKKDAEAEVAFVPPSSLGPYQCGEKLLGGN